MHACFSECAVTHSFASWRDEKYQVGLRPGVRDDLESPCQGRIDAGGVSFRRRRPFVRADPEGDGGRGHSPAPAAPHRLDHTPVARSYIEPPIVDESGRPEDSSHVLLLVFGRIQPEFVRFQGHLITPSASLRSSKVTCISGKLGDSPAIGDTIYACTASIRACHLRRAYTIVSPHSILIYLTTEIPTNEI